jgi:hypothetical protein
MSPTANPPGAPVHRRTTETAPRITAQYLVSRIYAVSTLAAMQEVAHLLPEKPTIDEAVLFVMTHSLEESFRNSLQLLQLGDAGKNLATLAAAVTGETSCLYHDRHAGGAVALSQFTGGNEIATCVVCADKTQIGHDIYIAIACADARVSRLISYVIGEMLGCRCYALTDDLLEQAREIAKRHNIAIRH